jgi:photosynthetic reaction center cytochrome c subunit
MRAWHPIAAIVGVLLVFGLVRAGWEWPPQESTQVGYRGTGMVQITDLKRYLDDTGARAGAEAIPAEIPPAPDGSPAATSQFKNLKVLTDVSSAELLRVMTAITAWVSPQQGCNYCHEGADLASDAKYTKEVARRMIEMVRHINSDWKSHVLETGVTCYTCHRGNPVPTNTWHGSPGVRGAGGMAQQVPDQNHPSALVGSTSLPSDPYSDFLERKENVRVVSQTALPEGRGASIQKTEDTYGLMMSISHGLGVNCTFCHNTRSFTTWEQSSPKRTLAWHGVRMVQDINVSYLDPLKPILPADRLGPNGDVLKVSCATCHQGRSRPLGGVSMVQTYPELQGNGGATTQGNGGAPQPQ